MGKCAQDAVELESEAKGSNQLLADHGPSEPDPAAWIDHSLQSGAVIFEVPSALADFSPGTDLEISVLKNPKHYAHSQ